MNLFLVEQFEVFLRMNFGVLCCIGFDFWKCRTLGFARLATFDSIICFVISKNKINFFYGLLQESHLTQTYHDGLLKLQAKEYEKACELLESVLKDPLISNAQVYFLFHEEDFSCNCFNFFLKVITFFFKKKKLGNIQDKTRSSSLWNWLQMWDHGWRIPGVMLVYIWDVHVQSLSLTLHFSLPIIWPFHLAIVNPRFPRCP